MKQFIGTKVINAKPMTKAEFNALLNWPFHSDADEVPGYLVEYTDGGKANVVGFKGYVSWSPKEQFEAAYRQTDGLPFGLAIEAMKKGLRVTRRGWNGNVLRTGFVPPSRDPVVYNGLGYILLASGEVAIFDPEDFDAVSSQSNWCLMGNGYPSFTQYAEGGGGEVRKTVKLHSLILPGNDFVDHINGDKLDNRRRNLRPCESAENCANRASVPGSSSRYKGVTWDKSRSKWMAAIAAGGKSKTLGRFESEHGAAKAYDIAAKAAYGVFAKLNFPDPGMWVSMTHGQIDLPAAKFWSENNRKHAEHLGGFATVLPCFSMKTASGEILMGWLASQTDMLADDWVIVADPEPPIFNTEDPDHAE